MDKPTTMENYRLNVIPVEIWVTAGLILAGFTVMGVGIGIYLNEVWASTLFGVGTAFLVNSILVLRSYYQRIKVTRS